MNYYKVIVSNKLGKDYFFYKSDFDISNHTIVNVPLRNKFLYGLIIEKVENIDKLIDFDKSLILDILYFYDIQINTSIINFLLLCNKTTFLTFNELFGQLIDNVTSHLGKNEIKKLQLDVKTFTSKTLITKPKSQLSLQDFKINYYIDIFIMLRIIYLIRSHIKLNINIQNTHKEKSDYNFLIFFPEIKILDKYKEQIENEINNLKNEYTNINFNVFSFNNNKGKESRKFISNIIKNQTVSKKINQTSNKYKTSYNIYITTKLGIFLPFEELEEIMVINEASSFYIQEQNSIYYDLRELVYILSSTYRANLSFISRLPSLRLYKHTSEAFNFKNDTSMYLNHEKFLNMQVCRSNFTDKDKNDLFSFQILETLCYLDD